MPFIKKTQDVVSKSLARVFLGERYVPRSLYELSNYFRIYGAINFQHHQGDNGRIVAVSTDYKYGSIITSAKNLEELDQRIKDAILTSFEVPSAYSKEAKIQKVRDRRQAYALA